MDSAGAIMPGRKKARPASGAEGELPFWRRLALEEMSDAEWESLCDGCGRCCLNKLEDTDTGDIYWTEVACRLLDDESCRCSDYPNRQSEVPDCVRLKPENVRGLDLYWWHPLVSGDRDTVHYARISVRGRTFSEVDVPVQKFEDHLVSWPAEDPAEKIEVAERGARKRRGRKRG
jgi:uncharacterized cysteine cluster protein YcgN (CxxCxxCC family)